MKISVVIPCYNASAYIEKTIVALANQEFDHDAFEVIFVDDCSSDNTVQTVEALIQQHSIHGKVLLNSKNTGPSLARKYGIEHAMGTYIAFCDSDDWYEPDFLKKMYEATEQETNQIVFCNYKLVYDSGRIIPKDNIGDPKRFQTKKEILTIDVDGLCGGIFQKNLFSDLNFPNIRNGEDMAIIPILIAKADRVGFVCEPIYNYYQRTGSLSTTQTQKMICNLQVSFSYICQALQKSHSTEVEYIGIRNILYGALLNLFKQGMKAKDAKEILDYFEEQFPSWHKNPYTIQLPSYKRIYLWCARHRAYLMMRILSVLHTQLTR